MNSSWDSATLAVEAFQDKSCLPATYLMFEAKYYLYLELVEVIIIRL